MKENHMIKQIKERIKETETGIIVAFAMCFLICIYAPMELFFTNKGDFWFDIYMLLPRCLILFIFTAFGSIVILEFAFRWKRMYYIVVGAYFVVLICTYIQGNFLIRGLPPLDGTDIVWSDYYAQRILSVLIWTAMVCMVLFCFKKMTIEKVQAMLKGISICLLLLLGFTLIMVCVANKGYEQSGIMTATTKNEFQMSEDTNCVILMLDAVDAWTFSNIIEKNSGYKDNLEDFTYYDNVVGAYPFTEHAVPFILSGMWYENEQSFETYMKDVTRESPFFLELESREYKLGIYDDAIKIPVEEAGTRFENMIANCDRPRSELEFVKVIVKMAGIKYAPFELKRFCYNLPLRVSDLRVVDTHEGEAVFDWSNLDLYEALLAEPTSYTSEKCFKMIHVEGAHVPYQYDEKLNVIENGTYEQNVLASLTLIDAYLNELRRAGVYDNSIIVIMADHGYDEENGRYGRQNPVLLVKGLNEKHPLEISKAPISYVDLQDAYVKLLDGKSSREIFEWEEGDERERRYLFYTYEEEDYMIEYIQTGQAKKLETMVMTGNEYIWEE